MPKRSGSYSVPFSFELLSFDEAVGLAADTGRISGDAGPLLETVVDMLDELGRPDEYFDCKMCIRDRFIGDLHKQANDVARESLALDALARELKIEVTEDDINAEFEKAGVKDVEASKAEFIADGRMPAVRESIPVSYTHLRPGGQLRHGRQHRRLPEGRRRHARPGRLLNLRSI